MFSGNDWDRIGDGAISGALSAWLDVPNDQSVSASNEAALGGGNARPEQDAIPSGNNGAVTGNTGWALPKGGTNVYLLAGLAVVGALAFAAVAK